ncbi:hypothetical protein AAMO2058_000798700 [Amorphochlora amoebiformis]
MSKPLLTLLLWVAGVASAGGASVSHGGTTLEGAIEGVEKLSDARAEPKAPPEIEMDMNDKVISDAMAAMSEIKEAGSKLLHQRDVALKERAELANMTSKSLYDSSAGIQSAAQYVKSIGKIFSTQQQYIENLKCYLRDVKAHIKNQTTRRSELAHETAEQSDLRIADHREFQARVEALKTNLTESETALKPLLESIRNLTASIQNERTYRKDLLGERKLTLKALTRKLAEATAKLKTHEDKDQEAKDRIQELSGKISELEQLKISKDEEYNEEEDEARHADLHRQRLVANLTLELKKAKLLLKRSKTLVKTQSSLLTCVKNSCIEEQRNAAKKWMMLIKGERFKFRELESELSKQNELSAAEKAKTEQVAIRTRQIQRLAQHEKAEAEQAAKDHEARLYRFNQTLVDFRDLVDKAMLRLDALTAEVPRAQINLNKHMLESKKGLSKMTLEMSYRQTQLSALKTNVESMERELEDWKSKIDTAQAMGESLRKQGDSLRMALAARVESRQRSADHFYRSLALADQAVAKIRSSLEEHQLYHQLLLADKNKRVNSSLGKVESFEFDPLNPSEADDIEPEEKQHPPASQKNKPKKEAKPEVPKAPVQPAAPAISRPEAARENATISTVNATQTGIIVEKKKEEDQSSSTIAKSQKDENSKSKGKGATTQKKKEVKKTPKEQEKKEVKKTPKGEEGKRAPRSNKRTRDRKDVAEKDNKSPKRLFNDDLPFSQKGAREARKKTIRVTANGTIAFSNQTSTTNLTLKLNASSSLPPPPSLVFAPNPAAAATSNQSVSVNASSQSVTVATTTVTTKDPAVTAAKPTSKPTPPPTYRKAKNPISIPVTRRNATKTGKPASVTAPASVTGSDVTTNVTANVTVGDNKHEPNATAVKYKNQNATSTTTTEEGNTNTMVSDNEATEGDVTAEAEGNVTASSVTVTEGNVTVSSSVTETNVTVSTSVPEKSVPASANLSSPGGTERMQNLSDIDDLIRATHAPTTIAPTPKPTPPPTELTSKPTAFPSPAPTPSSSFPTPDPNRDTVNTSSNANAPIGKDDNNTDIIVLRPTKEPTPCPVNTTGYPTLPIPPESVPVPAAVPTPNPTDHGSPFNATINGSTTTVSSTRIIDASLVVRTYSESEGGK